ncbi:thioesterase family protein [Lapillicoccus sp.]|uniref:thioesterase family protein n=1 Tax=Lapillicoccus sp. TaxID=1909287 RepID=UPI00398353FC
MTSEFDLAMDLAPRTAGAGCASFTGRFTHEWMIGNAVNGGVVMSLATTALQRQLAGSGGHQDLLAFSGYFLTPSAPGEVVVETTVLRSGRTLSTGQMSVSQTGPDAQPVERLRALASFGDLDASAEVLRSAAPPLMAPPEQCLATEQLPPSFLNATSLLERLDLRIDPATAGWASGKPSGKGEMRGWLRLRDGRAPDPTVLLFALDALPPVAFDLGILGWAPTLEFTGHVRGRPASGWLQVALTSENLTRGLMEEDARIWDSTGRLVAQSRQLCGVRIPATS